MPGFQLDPLRRFVVALAELIDSAPDEGRLLKTGGQWLGALVADDDWLPAVFAEPDPDGYRQYLLHCDSAERFSVVSFVWGPGQSTPIHDHTVWGLVGVLRGAEVSQSYARRPDGSLAAGQARVLQPGQVESFSPWSGDIHQVSNALLDRASVSIHVYGANIGSVRRSIFDADGGARPFVSGYSNALIPNLWNGPANVVPAS